MKSDWAKKLFFGILLLGMIVIGAGLGWSKEKPGPFAGLTKTSITKSSLYYFNQGNLMVRPVSEAGQDRIFVDNGFQIRIPRKTKSVFVIKRGVINEVTPEGIYYSILTLKNVAISWDVAPDGSEFVVAWAERGGSSQVYRYQRSSKKWSLVSDINVGGIYPSYSSDGKKVVYCSSRKLWIADLKSGVIKKLVDDELLKEVPDWSSDGRHIVYQAAQDTKDAKYDIWMVDARTGKTKQLTAWPGLDCNPCFDATGKKILYITQSIDTPLRHFAVIDVNGKLLDVLPGEYDNKVWWCAW